MAATLSKLNKFMKGEKMKIDQSLAYLAVAGSTSSVLANASFCNANFAACN